jgi:hypothetical protein
MKQYWSEGEFVEFWTLTDVKRQFSDQRTPRGRLGLAVLWKFFQSLLLDSGVLGSRIVREAHLLMEDH